MKQLKLLHNNTMHHISVSQIDIRQGAVQMQSTKPSNFIIVLFRTSQAIAPIQLSIRIIDNKHWTEIECYCKIEMTN